MPWLQKPMPSEYAIADLTPTPLSVLPAERPRPFLSKIVNVIGLQPESSAMATNRPFELRIPPGLKVTGVCSSPLIMGQSNNSMFSRSASMLSRSASMAATYLVPPPPSNQPQQCSLFKLLLLLGFKFVKKLWKYYRRKFISNNNILGEIENQSEFKDQ